MSAQKDSPPTEQTSSLPKQAETPSAAVSSENEQKEAEKKDVKSTAPQECSTPNNTSASPLPLSPIPTYYYHNGTPSYIEATAAEAYQATMSAGYDPNDPNAFAAYGQYGMHPQYSQYYPAEYSAAYPGTPPMQAQASPSLPPQSLSPYFGATSPTIAYYPTSPQVGPTGIIHSPPMHPYVYTPQSPYTMHPIHTLSPTLSHTSSSAPNSPPPQYLPGPGVPSPKVGPLNNHRIHLARSPQHYSYGRRDSGSNQPSNMPNYHNPTKTTNIYIRGLPPTTTDDSLHSMCSIYGSITSSKAIIDQKQGDCKGYGFVMYETEDQAKHAIEQLTRVGLQVSFAKESFSTKLKNLQDLASTNIYLSNLPLDMNEQQLEELFKPYKVLSNRILRDTNGTSRGVGFARMEDRDSAQAIIQQFNGYQLPGANLPLQVRFADSLAQKKLKGTARKRMWRTREFASIGGVPVTPEHMLGMAASASPPGPTAYIPYYPEGVQPAAPYPQGSLSPTFGPQYRYYPMYPAPAAPIHHGPDGQPVVATAPIHQVSSQPGTQAEQANTVSSSEKTSKESTTGTSGTSKTESSEDLSDLVQKKLNVDGVNASNNSESSNDKN
ncbi:5363_t:CDS:2 [Paraglomus brasilianum]|uniref:5363_t:CDS:1 n=1 Tax=Paraglomus brasilianum TaxID=144538 RepID=A0A9N8Z0E2_9GLOM|nr:5363_t:CDS:2 [Paraglomus brasilianum]